MQIADTRSGNLLFPDNPGRGVLFAEIDEKRLDLDIIQGFVHSRFFEREAPHELAAWPLLHFESVERESLITHGTLDKDGFVEISSDEKGRLYLIICSGSGRFGQEFISYYSNLFYYDWDIYSHYLDDMRALVSYARQSRNIMGLQLAELIGLKNSRHYIYDGIQGDTLISQAVLTENGFLIFAKGGELLCSPADGRKQYLPCRVDMSPEKLQAWLEEEKIKVIKRLDTVKRFRR